MARTAMALVGALLVAACSGPPPGPSATTPGTAAAPATAAPPAPAAPALPAVPAPAATGLAPGPDMTQAMPDGALYACVVYANEGPHITTIELEPKVTKLCTKNPEMSPCQYAREACRAGGGRVFGPGGHEITRATEAEYDRHVMRIRLQSN